MHIELLELEKEKIRLAKELDKSFQYLQIIYDIFSRYKPIKKIEGINIFEKKREFNLKTIKEIITNHQFIFKNDFKLFKKKFNKIFHHRLFDFGSFNENQLEFIWLYAHDKTDLNNPYFIELEKIKKAGWLDLIKKQEELLKEIKNPPLKIEKAIKKIKKRIEKEKEFVLTLTKTKDISRREFLKFTGKLITTTSLSVISGYYLLSPPFIKIYEYFEKNQKKKIFKAYYDQRYPGDIINKKLEIPFCHNSKYKIRDITFSIKKEELIELATKNRSFETFKKIKDLTKTSKKIDDFSKELIDIKEQRILSNKYRLKRYSKDYIILQTVLSFLKRNIKYIADSKKDRKVSSQKEIPYDKSEYFKYPEQTLIDGFGDCEDFSILAASLLRPHRIKTEIIITKTNIKNTNHALIGILTKIDLIEDLLSLFYSLKTDRAAFPLIFLPKEVKLPIISTQLKEEFLTIIEPQKYDINTLIIDLKAPSGSINGKIKDIGNEYNRVLITPLSTIETKYKIEKFSWEKLKKGFK